MITPQTPEEIAEEITKPSFDSSLTMIDGVVFSHHELRSKIAAALKQYAEQVTKEKDAEIERLKDLNRQAKTFLEDVLNSEAFKRR